MITVPEGFRVDLGRHAGGAGLAWIDDLPAVVADLARRWGLTVDGPPMHGGMGLVVPVDRTGEPCVLKLSWADTTAAKDTLALRVWDGAGAVRLLREETAERHHAMLLERLDADRTLASVPIDEAVTVAGRLIRRLAVPAPTGITLLSELAASTVDQLHEQAAGLGVPTRSLDAAIRLAGELGPSAQRLMIHDDLHYDNVLAGTREPWLAVDPTVVAGDPEYAVGPLLWCRLDPTPGTDTEDPSSYAGPVREAVVPRRLDQLVEAGGLDPERALGWAVVRCVGYHVWGLQVGLTYDPARCAAIVDRLLDPEML